MCGIVAAHGPVPDEICERMLDRLEHRGPDGRGSVRIAGSWLGHQRLAIVDVAGGEQPMADAAGTTSVVCNGEIYNHEALRARLGVSSFLTRSDTEAALQLFVQAGATGLRALEGMFALAIASTDGRFAAVRDPVGIKPLYWAQRNGATLFASELKAFPKDWRQVVREFPIGHLWTPEGGLVQLFDGAATARQGASYAKIDEPSEEVFTRLRESLIGAVERRMMSDVPVGVFLSGGLDSSLVSAIAAQLGARDGKRVPSFGVGLEGSSDILAARAVAEAIGTDHHEHVYRAEDLLAALPATIRCIESFDPMLVHSAVPNFLLAAFTAQHVKVVLTGEGADELFAGYQHYRDLANPDELHEELVRSVEGLHNLNLQRCDRVTMAHSLEARVPFLDTKMIDIALSLPAAWKQPRRGRPEKWLLRKAFDGWLPDDFLWRSKEQFGDGTGASTILRDAAELACSQERFLELHRQIHPPLRSREEAVYWQLFHEDLTGIVTQDIVGRFAVA